MTESAPTALVVEDELQIRHFLRMALEAEGWRVVESASMQRGLIDAGSRKPDLVILDLGLPDGDGNDFIRQFREWSSVPVVVLSARSQEAEKIRALDLGADDYLTKPFGVGELLARLRAAVRRQRPLHTEPDGFFQFGNVKVNLGARMVIKNNRPIHLTPIEYRLLSVLITNAGKVVTNPHLLQEVWGPSHVDRSHYLRVYMGHIRQKLEDDPAQPKYLLTETAVGYRLVLPDEQ